MEVRSPDGLIGTIVAIDDSGTDSTEKLTVHGANREEIILQPGSYLVKNGAVHVDTPLITADAATGQSVVIPVIREEAQITARVVEQGGVRVRKWIEEHEETVDQYAYREEVSVERVTIGKPITEHPEARQEGDTLIVPVLEEVLVVEKRLMLKEEIRITKRRIEDTTPAQVVLREEHVEVEPLDGSDTVA